MAKRERKPKRVASPTVPPLPANDQPANDYEEWQSQLTPREKRIDEIVGMMSRGQWMAGASHRLLAKQWGFHPGYVEQMAGEASRLIRRAVRETPEGRAAALAIALQNFEVIRIKAMSYDSPHGLRVALDATEMQLRYLGLEPPKNLRIAQGDAEFSKLNDAQLERLANGQPLEDGAEEPEPDEGVH